MNSLSDCSPLICVSALLRSVLTVACEQTEVLLFDPISSRHIKTLTEAHEDCVNNIRCISIIFILLLVNAVKVKSTLDE